MTEVRRCKVLLN